MDNQRIQLTEQDLHMLVEDAVQLYLTENGMEEGVGGYLSGIGQRMGNKLRTTGENLGKSVSGGLQYIGNKAAQVGQYANKQYTNAKQGLQNMQQAGQISSINQDAQKAINDATSALQNLMTLSGNLQKMGQNPVIGANTQPIIKNCLAALKQISGRFKGRRTMAVN